MLHAVTRHALARLLPGELAPWPLALTLTVTSTCPLTCPTCRVQEMSEQDLEAAGWQALMGRLPESPLWVTVTGGEPTFREDLPALLDGLAHHRGLRAVTLCTSGLLPDRVQTAVRTLLRATPRAVVVVNLSIDGPPAEHDRLRGLPGLFSRVGECIRLLRALGDGRVVVGVNTVLSSANIDLMEQTVDAVQALGVDSHVLEPAGLRAELEMFDSSLVPPADRFEKAAQRLLSARHLGGVPAGIVRGLRAGYYREAARVLRGGHFVRICSAGRAAAHISPGGRVWPCSVLGGEGNCLGSLPEVGYDWQRMWNGPAARRVRRRIGRSPVGCRACTLANAFYINTLLDPGRWPAALAAAARSVVPGPGRAPSP